MIKKTLITCVMFAVGFTTGWIIWDLVWGDKPVITQPIEIPVIDYLPALTDWDIFYMALIEVESGGDPNAIGQTNDGGHIQITPIYIKDVNRILGYDKYTLECRFDTIKSREMFDIIQDHYNPNKDINKAIKIHNPKAGKWYKQRIMKVFYRIKKEINHE